MIRDEDPDSYPYQCFHLHSCRLLPAALGLIIGLALRWLHIAEPKQTNAA